MTTHAIRAPRDADAEALADLSTQLGYPVGADELGQRLTVVAGNDHAAVLVATDGSDRPLGWIHVELKRTLVAPLTAQVMGLVVDERARNGGMGRELLAAGEEWAASRGCRHMLVGTRVTREGAHRFYTREGYTLQKTSHFFGEGYLTRNTARIERVEVIGLYFRAPNPRSSAWRFSSP